MRALADDGARGAIGCTQITEIRATSGVVLVGALPPPFELSTIYAVAAMRDASDATLAGEWIACLTEPEASAIRREAGFDA
jgi:molybdate transport system substrate-binding protein